MKWLKFGCKFSSKWLSFQSQSTHEALRLINAVVSAYVEAMVQEHERSKFPSVRMQLDVQPPR